MKGKKRSKELLERGFDVEADSSALERRLRHLLGGQSSFSLRGTQLRSHLHGPGGLRFDPQEVRYRYSEESMGEQKLRSLRALSGMTFGACWDLNDPRLQIESL